MKVKVKTLRGKLYCLEGLTEKMTLYDFKEMFSKQVNVPPQILKFVYKGKLLKSGTLEHNLIKDGDFLVVFPSQKYLSQKEPKKRDKREKKSATSDGENSFTSTSPVKTSSKKIRKEKKVPKTSNSIISSPQFHLDPNIFGIMNQSHLDPNSNVLKEGTSIDLRFSPLRVDSPKTSELNSQNPPEKSSTIDPVALQTLQDMGFSQERSKKALLLNKMNTQLAMEWLLENEGEVDVDEPLSEEQLHEITQEDSSFSPDESLLQRLKDMGFSDEDISAALRVTGNNFEDAAAWLLGDRDLGEGSEDESIILDESNPLMQELMNNPAISTSLSNPRVSAALKSLLESSSTENVNQYINDPEIGPVLVQVLNILNSK